MEFEGRNLETLKRADTSDDQSNRLRDASRIELHLKQVASSKGGKATARSTWHDTKSSPEETFADIYRANFLRSAFPTIFFFYFYIDHLVECYHDELRGERERSKIVKMINNLDGWSTIDNSLFRVCESSVNLTLCFEHFPVLFSH